MRHRFHVETTSALQQFNSLDPDSGWTSFVAGGAMKRASASDNRLLRSLVGCAVAYALIINALLSGLVGAEWVAQAAAGLVGEHCLTDARAAGLDPAPAGQPDDSSHCAFCMLADGGPVVLPVAPSAADIIWLPEGTASSASDRDLVYQQGHPAKLPRGPPQRA
jgi:hypothetical protein